MRPDLQKAFRADVGLTTLGYIDVGILKKTNRAFSILGRCARVTALEASGESTIPNETADYLFFPLTIWVEAAREEGTNHGVSAIV